MEGVLAYGVLERLVERVKGNIGDSNMSLPVTTCAASLAHHGYLGSVEVIVLGDVGLTSTPADHLNVDLTTVPDKHLASLVSSVTGWVEIQNVRGCDLVSILDSVKSKLLGIYGRSLSSEETRALVRAMETGVKRLELGEGVTLDIGELMQYSGQGKCREVGCYEDTAARYRDQLRIWATSRNLEVTGGGELDNRIFIRRI